MSGEARSEEWSVGHGCGITGPTCPSVLGPTVSESYERYQYDEHLEKRKIDPSLPCLPMPRRRHEIVTVLDVQDLHTYCRSVVAIIPHRDDGSHADIANKIAAAPELYDTLKRFVAAATLQNINTGGHSFTPILNDAKAALAKAEGRANG